MNMVLQYLIDFIFPPTDEELQLRTVDRDWLYQNGSKAIQTEFPFIDAVFSYKDPITKEMIWQIKYKKNKHALELAGYALYKTICEHYKKNESRILNEIDGEINLEKSILIPIPISKKRRKERGYNQCELIINEIVKLDIQNLIKKDFELLIREKDIEKQTFKNRDERISNTKHIFKVMKEPANTIEQNQQIIIIDDVTTTGSTLKEARDELLKVGYKNVSALTIAH